MWGVARSAQPLRGNIVHEGESKYNFINPILSCEIGTQDTFVELDPVRSTVEKYIRSVEAGGTTDAAMYFRLLNSGRWFGIDEDQTYAPASLLKVIVMVSYLKAAETDPGILARTIYFPGNPKDADADAAFSTAGPLPAGRYTIEQLINKMIVDSSNDALNLLMDSIDEKTFAALKETSSDLNIPLEPLSKNLDTNFLSPKTYSMIYRVLFGSTYLDRETSEKALALLSQTTFAGGLTARLPSTLVVAHKFGIKTIPAANGAPAERELHDCGIVYYPRHPYLICIMTRGNDFKSLGEAIAGISKTTYDAIDLYWKKRVTSVSSNQP